MKALVYKNGALSYTADYPLPEPEPDESLILGDQHPVRGLGIDVGRGAGHDAILSWLAVILDRGVVTSV